MKSRPWLLWSTLVLFSAFLAAWGLTTPPSAQGRIDAVPAAGLAFSLERLPWSPSELATLQDAGGAKWRCRTATDDLVLIAIDGARNLHAVHDPVFCSRGAGFQVAAESEILLPGGTGKQLRLQNGSETRELVYWFSNGESRYHSLLRFRTDTARARLHLGSEAPLMILLYGPARTPQEWADIVDVLPFMQQL